MSSNYGMWETTGIAVQDSQSPCNSLKATMFEQTFNNIDNILRKDDGCGTELDYVE